MSSEERITAVHGRAADGVFHEVGVDVDAAVFEEEAEAVLAFEHIGHGLAEVGFARHARGMRFQQVKNSSTSGRDSSCLTARR